MPAIPEHTGFVGLMSRTPGRAYRLGPRIFENSGQWLVASCQTVYRLSTSQLT